MSKAKKLSAVPADDYESKPYLSSVDAKDLPAIKDWKVGGEYELTVKVRLTSMNEYEKSPLSASFDVLEVSSKSKTDDAFEKGFDKKSYS